MHKLGKKQLLVELKEPALELPSSFKDYSIALSQDGFTLTYTYDTAGEGTGITGLLQMISDTGLTLKDIKTTQSSLEDIFVDLLHHNRNEKNYEPSRN